MYFRCGGWRIFHRDIWHQTLRLKRGNLYMDVSENSGTPKSSILIGFSIINHPFWGTPIFGNTHMQHDHDTFHKWDWQRFGVTFLGTFVYLEGNGGNGDSSVGPQDREFLRCTSWYTATGLSWTQDMSGCQIWCQGVRRWRPNAFPASHDYANSRTQSQRLRLL